MADYTAVIRLEPKNPAAYVNRGRAFAKLGSLERAVREYAEAYVLDRAMLPILKDGILELAQDGQAEAAARLIDNLARRTPENKEIRHLQSLVGQATKKRS